MKKTIDIEIPKDYSAVSLKKYLRIYNHLKNIEAKQNDDM